MPDSADKNAGKPKKAEQKRDSSGGKSSKKGQQAPKSAAELRQEEWDKMIDSMISSHAGWLAPVITGVATTFSTPPTTAACYLAAGLLVLLLVSPANWVPHIAAPVVLLIPLQNTLMSVSLETKKTRSAAADSAQWVVFWLVWCILGRIGSWLAVFRPGWMALWEVTRAVALVIVAGPWFGRAGLRPDPPSVELVAAEMREAAAAEKEAKAQAQKKEKDDKAQAKKDDKEAKAKKEAKEKAAKEQAKKKAEAKAKKDAAAEAGK